MSTDSFLNRKREDREAAAEEAQKTVVQQYTGPKPAKRVEFTETVEDVAGPNTVTVKHSGASVRVSVPVNRGNRPTTGDKVTVVAETTGEGATAVTRYFLAKETKPAAETKVK